MNETCSPTPQDACSPDEETLEALYNVNKHAKKYAELGTKNYRAGKKTTAKANSNKKKALYSVKERVLEELLPKADEIAVHEINDREFYCLYFNDWSFHTPITALDIDASRVDETDMLDDFEADSEKERSDKSLKSCLLHLESEFGVNANEHLPQKFLSYGYNNHFIGWKYLGEDDNNTTQTEL